MKNPFTDFGFSPGSKSTGAELVLPEMADEGIPQLTQFRHLHFGPLAKKKKQLQAIWTAVVYVCFSGGIFLRQTVNFPNAGAGLNGAGFKLGVLAASFIIGLGMLAPLLRVISKYNKGSLSWQHCLTALTMGFLGDLTFNLMIKGFMVLLKL